MKRFMMMAVVLGGLMVVGTSTAKADHYYGRGRSNFGISISYGNGFNNVGGYYGRSVYSRPYSGYGYGYGGGYPAYRPVRVYSAPAYYSAPVYGGGYGRGVYGGFGYGGHHGRHCR